MDVLKKWAQELKGGQAVDWAVGSHSCTLMQNGARNTMKDMNNKAAAIMDSLGCSCEHGAPC